MDDAGMKIGSTLIGAMALALPLLGSSAVAQDSSPEESAAASGASSDRLFDAVRLENMIVHGERLEPVEELALRLVSWGLNTHRSTAEEDARKPYCWFANGRGSHIQYLYCSTNRYRNMMSANAQVVKGQMVPDKLGGVTGMMRALTRGNFGGVVRSQHPLTERQVEDMLSLLGSPSLNREIVERALATDTVPKGVPYAHEIEQFTDALAQVRAINARYADRIQDAVGDIRKRLIAESDAEMAAAIQAAGLSVERYNEISVQVEKYPTLQASVRKQLAAH